MAYEPLPAALLCRARDWDQLEPLLRGHGEALLDYGGLSGEAGWYFALPKDVCLQWPQTVAWLSELSRVAPLLYYLNIETYGHVLHPGGERYQCDWQGWGYRLYAEGAAVAEAFFPYDMPSYGEALRAALASSLAAARPEAFRCFDLPPPALEGLLRLLSPAGLLAVLEAEYLDDAAAEFTRLLGIEGYVRS